MKKTAWMLLLTLSLTLLATGVSIAARSQVISVGVLPVQDESGAQVPGELLRRIGQDLRQRLTLSFQDVLVRPVRGLPETPGTEVGQLAAMGKQQGFRHLLRSGVLVLKCDRGATCDISLYAELIASDNGEITNLRANGTASDANSKLDDPSRWDAYDFKSGAFAQTALGQALNSAIDQLAQQVHQAVAPSSQPMPETAATSAQPPPPAGNYEADQELQQLIAQADSLVAGGVASGRDIGSLQRALEGLRTALNDKVALMTEGRDTSGIDQEISQHKTELQNIIAASTQEAVNQPPQGEPRQDGGDLKSGITKVNELLGEALNSLLKIQEISNAVQSFRQGQAPPQPADTGQTSTPVEEPTSEVSGVVTDSSGNPVEGAMVTEPQSGASATTDSAGSYLIPFVPSGRFSTFKVTKNGRDLSTGKIQLLPGRMGLADWQVGAGVTGMKAQGIKILPATVVVTPKTGVRTAELGTIKGLVRDDQGRPVARAQVMIKGLGMARTDSQGGYMFVNVPRGDYQVVVRKGGSTVQTQQVGVIAKKVVECKTVYKGKAISTSSLGRKTALALVAGASLKGKVCARNRLPLPGAKVTTVYSGGAMSVIADAKGNYEFKDLKQGTYRLLANKAGYQEAGRDVVLKGRQSEVRDFVLDKSSAEIQKVLTARPSTIPARTEAATSTSAQRPALAAKGHLSGVVRDARSGKPIEDATVRVYGQKFARTDRQGIYRISDLPPGNYRVGASHREYLLEERSLTVRPDITGKEYFSLKGKEQSAGIPDKPMQLTPAASFGQVRGRITDSRTGKPVAHARISLLNRATQTNAAGHYNFENIPAGSHTLTIEKSDYEDGSRRITVRDGKSTTVDFRLVPNPGGQFQQRHLP